MLRSLTHYWRINLAVMLAAAVATAVLSGALVVGDSVRGSLRELTLDRLGRISHALVTERFFREDLADGFSAPAILLRGAARHADSGSRASQVALIGIDERFHALFSRLDGASDLDDLHTGRQAGQIFPSVVINESLARELGAEAGDSLLLSFGRSSRAPRDTLMGERDPEDVLLRFRVQVIRVIQDRGVGRFGLSPHQINPRNAFVSLNHLQRALEQSGKINCILLSYCEGSTQPGAILGESIRLEDLGLMVELDRDHLVVQSREFVLRPDVDEAIGAAAARIGAPILRIQSYVANAMKNNGRLLPYSLITAVDAPGPWESSSLKLADGSQAPPISEEGILLNTWAAEDLKAEVGDTIEVAYYVVGPHEQLDTRRTLFKLEGIAAMEGLGASRDLVPDYPGLQEAEDISAWDPPFPVDLSLIRKKDEAYWDSYGATPKAFLSEGTGRRLWKTRFGSTTSIQVGAAPGEDLLETRRRLRRGLLEELPPESLGFSFRPVRKEGLEAATGATDFSGLFIGFSFFLIVSSALLVGLLFSLGVEGRAREIGLLRAVGYRLRSIRSRLLVQGGVVAGVGALLGVAGGIGYAWLLMTGLRTLWLPAVGSTSLFVHVEPSSLALGWGVAVVVILLSILGSVLRLSRVPPPSLLAGSLGRLARPGRRRVALWLAVLSTAGGLGCLAFTLLAGNGTSPGLAFGTGSLLLVAGLAVFSLWCRRSRGMDLSRALVGMAARNTSWSPGRSLLSVALVGSACFVIVAVAANREELGEEELLKKSSGTGGFTLVAESDVPLHQNPGRAQDRLDLGFSEADSEKLEPLSVYPFRLLPGEDASCLNLYRPERPRVLGVPEEFVRRGGFQFQESLELPEGEDDPWSLLETPLEPGVIPAIGDANSVRWILHLGLGEELVLDNELGEPVRLRLVGLLRGSILQSELLISEVDFLKHFPGRTGYGYFLMETPLESSREIARLLESALGPFGFDTTTTREKLAGFKAVEHTYLSTFQALGGLGLLLGTLGLGIVLVRNVIERRGELAVLRAFGFRRSSLAWMVLAENAFLLLAGVLIGSLSALLAVAPRLAAIQVPWLSLSMTLGVVFLVGMLSSVLAVLGALRVPLLPALKAER